MKDRKEFEAQLAEMTDRWQAVHDNWMQVVEALGLPVGSSMRTVIGIARNRKEVNRIVEKAGDLEKVTQWSSGDAALFNSGLLSALLSDLNEVFGNSCDSRLNQQFTAKLITERYTKLIQPIFVTDYKG